VRSKNEVIIAEILNELARSSWLYEKHLTGSDGRVRLPDFTIETPDGRTVYWEHLGLLHDPKYRHGWEKKRRGTPGKESCHCRKAAVRTAVWCGRTIGAAWMFRDGARLPRGCAPVLRDGDGSFLSP
jgi:hypothetical protein